MNSVTASIGQQATITNDDKARNQTTKNFLVPASSCDEDNSEAVQDSHGRDEENQARNISDETFRLSAPRSPISQRPAVSRESPPFVVISPSPSLHTSASELVTSDKDSSIDSFDSGRITAQHIKDESDVESYESLPTQERPQLSANVPLVDFPCLLSSVDSSNSCELEVSSVDEDIDDKILVTHGNTVNNNLESAAKDNDILRNSSTVTNNNHIISNTVKKDVPTRRITRSITLASTLVAQGLSPSLDNDVSNGGSSGRPSSRHKSKRTIANKISPRHKITRSSARERGNLPKTGTNTGVSAHMPVENKYVPSFPESNLPMPKICVTNTGNGYHCLIHEPSLQELESLNSFGSYIRDVVLPAANMYEIDKNHPNYLPDFYMKTKMELGEGMALVRLPRNGFGCSKAASDRTGRGPLWQEGTELGDWIIEAPMEQIVMGIGGVYEFTFVDKPPITMADFRKRADAHKEQQIGNFINRVNTKRKDDSKLKQQPSNETNENLADCIDIKTTSNPFQDSTATNSMDKQHSNDQPMKGECCVNAEEDIELLERQFWKRIGPTMIPAWYGADQEDTLFFQENEIDHADPSKCNAAATWSLSQLDSCLQVLPPIPGVTSPYLYVGMWGSVFCSHTEDMNLLSINYLHAGSPKYWYSIAEPDAARYKCLAEHYYARVAGTCKEFLRHKRYLLSPAILQKAGIRYQTAIQYPGDAIITMPGGYHFGFNLGFNVAEATNFGVPEWLPFGREAKVCLCRPDSVRIDMFRLTKLICKFHIAQKRNRRLTFAEWKKKLDWQNRIHGIQTDNTNEATVDVSTKDNDGKAKRKRMTGGSTHHVPIKLTEQQRRNEFWIEVMKPVSADGKTGAAKKKRKKTARKKLTPDNTEKNEKKQGEKTSEIWHLAKPINKTSNKIVVNSRVLCIIPASQNLQHINFNGITGELANSFFDNNSSLGMQQCSDDFDEQMDEQCFAGQIVEIIDHFARIHLIGLHRTEDIWMSIYNPRLFLDGGQFIHGVHEDIPPLHYWKEMDSKTRLG